MAGFKLYLRHHRRYVWESKWEEKISPRPWIDQAAERSTLELPAGHIIWRARIRKPGETWEPSARNLGAPDPYLIRRGQRASAAGIRVFYGAGDIDTALAETRPSLKAAVYVTQWRLLKPLRLCNFHVSENAADEEWVKYFRHVSRLMSWPIDPNDEELDYVLTQYIVETVMDIKDEQTGDARFDGVQYESAQNRSGSNIVVFEPSNLELASEPQCVTVDAVKYNTVLAEENSTVGTLQNIKIEMPGELLEKVDALCARTASDRSGVIRRALERLLDDGW